MVKGYKVFNHDWTCNVRGNVKQYACPGKFEEDVQPIVCKSGMHFCKKAVDCFNYHVFDPSKKVAEVIAYGKISEFDDKCCTDKLEIVREISWEELLMIINIGEGCNGKLNTGDKNFGHRNTGCRNNGHGNSGNCNNGGDNSGGYNNGYVNTGDYNDGCWNSGNYNMGNYNTGDANIGHGNTGKMNIGDDNTGDFNLCNRSGGCFNTVEQKIYLFNKPSNLTHYAWRKSEAFDILKDMPTTIVEFIDYGKMTEEEKQKHPSSKTTGGYLKYTRCTHKQKQEWWDKLLYKEKEIIKSIPNFDAAIFKQITGIDVEA